MCDCIHPVVNTLVDLICPYDTTSDPFKKPNKKNDDWEYRKKQPAIAQVVFPHSAQTPATLQSTNPAGLNYRRPPSQYTHRHHVVDPLQRPLLADARLHYNTCSSPNGADKSSNPDESIAIEEGERTPTDTAINMPSTPNSLPPSVDDVEIGAPRDASYPPHPHPPSPDAISALLHLPPPPLPNHLHPPPHMHPSAPAPGAFHVPPPPGQFPGGFWGNPLSPPPNAGSHLALVPQYSLPNPTISLPGSKHLEINFFELRLGQVIGEGGFGKVYYGDWRGLPVAVKVMGTDASSRASVVQEFTREVCTMSNLPPHPNVLRLVAACTAPPNLALVTEYCNQGSLYALLHSPTTYLSWVHIVRICLAAAQGMTHLHEHHVLHRDLKSGNLLVTGDLEVKVADFGLSKVYQDLQTMTGGLGTYQWMAPEVLANQRYSEKADVYSFGIVMWECCARQVPYAGLNGMQAALSVMNRGLRPDIPRPTPEPLAALIRRCWAALPEQRPSFTEIVATLEAMHEEVAHAESGTWGQ